MIIPINLNLAEPNDPNGPDWVNYKLDIQDLTVDIPPPILIASLHLQTCLTKYLKGINGSDVEYVLFKAKKGTMIDVCLKPLGDPEKLARKIMPNLSVKRTHIFGSVYDNYYKEVNSFFFRDRLNRYMKNRLYFYITKSDFFEDFVLAVTDMLCKNHNTLDKESIRGLVSSKIKKKIYYNINSQEKEVVKNCTIISAIKFLTGYEFEGQKDIIKYLGIAGTTFINGFFGGKLTDEVRSIVEINKIAMRFEECDRHE